MAAVRTLAKEWSAAWNRSDADGLLSLFTGDPVLLPQGRPAVTGKKAIRSLYRSFFKDYTVKGRGRVVEVEVSGDLGYFWSRYTLTAAPKAGGKKVAEKGRSLFIVRRRKDGAWKIARLIDTGEGEE
jgi:uncharacterized protein (TIGR02246 family)